MPRQFDAEEQERTGEVLRFSANVDCLRCAVVYEGTWTDSSISVEDMVDAPVQEQTCPQCGYVQEEEYPGWMFRSEAG